MCFYYGNARKGRTAQDAAHVFQREREDLRCATVMYRHQVMCAQLAPKGAAIRNTSSKPSLRKRRKDSLDEAPAERPEPKRRKSTACSLDGEPLAEKTSRHQHHSEAEPQTQPASSGADCTDRTLDTAASALPVPEESRELPGRSTQTQMDPVKTVDSVASVNLGVDPGGKSQAQLPVMGSSGSSQHVTVDSKQPERGLASVSPVAMEGADTGAAAVCVPSTPFAPANDPLDQPGKSFIARIQEHTDEQDCSLAQEEHCLCLVPLVLSNGVSGVGSSGKEVSFISRACSFTPNRNACVHAQESMHASRSCLVLPERQIYYLLYGLGSYYISQLA